MIYWHLFFEFFKIGVFSFGGGYATIPFLYSLSVRYGWFSQGDIVNMLAISQSTPGPIGINMATFAGYKTAGTVGSVIATFGIVLPSFIIICAFAKFLNRFQDRPSVKTTLWGLRPAACALIAYAMAKILKVSVLNFSQFHMSGQIIDLFNFRMLMILAILALLNKKYRLNYGFQLLIAGGLGALFFA
jgi:chromate transporter